MKTTKFMNALVAALCLTGCASNQKQQTKDVNINQQRAEETLDSLYSHYGVEGSCLLRETFPFDENYKATYLASEEQANRPNPYSYLWPFSGSLSGVSALYETTKDEKFRENLDKRTLVGLEEYFDTSREPHAYSSYISSAPLSDRFYDDNIWLGIDFTDLYAQTQNSSYLEKAKLIWKFIESGTDDKLGGGIYWCEQKKASKNTCSNAPGSVLALKLFKATQDSTYFKQGKALYEWTQTHLQDSDFLYFDNIGLNGNIGKAKFAYNSGQMMQSAALLYTLTKEEKYLTDAQNIAKACLNYFFSDKTDNNGQTFKMINKGNIWFTAVMLRGFIELYNIDGNKTYLDAFNKSLDYAWEHGRDAHGLFNEDLTGEKQDNKKSVLTQGAMVEMYARLAAIYQ